MLRVIVAQTSNTIQNKASGLQVGRINACIINRLSDCRGHGFSDRGQCSVWAGMGILECRGRPVCLPFYQSEIIC